jgi:glycosyltransferase involved in cell wall biosynthesis
MKICFISEYFPPFAPGGAEWSTFYLARDLVKRGEKVYIITPNYGTIEKQLMEGIIVIRFPFFKLNKDAKMLDSFYYLNPLWVLWAAWFIYKNVASLNLDLLHIHGKYSIPPVKIANLFLRKKILITIRDYQVICNYGFCIYNKNTSCTLKEYIFSDFIYYWKNYVTKPNILSFLFNVLTASVGRLNRNILKNFAINERVIVLSKKQQQIFKSNGFKNVSVIGNSTEFFKKPKIIQSKKNILFVGRLTLGKGVGLITELLPSFFLKYPNYKFIFAGSGPLKNKLLKMSQKNNRIKVLGEVSHNKLNQLYSESLITTAPSLWQEPFGRVPLESLAAGTPVVVTNKGGLPEIVKNGRWGYIVEAASEPFLRGLAKSIENNKTLRKNITKDFEVIKNKFGMGVVDKYTFIYRRMLKLIIFLNFY